MDETFRSIIYGISIGLRLGTNSSENTLTLHYLGYLIFATIKKNYTTLPSYHPFPSILSKIRRCFDIGKLVSVKKI
jgi:hypothetical protein